MKPLFFLCLISIVGLAGCASNDPHSDNFFQGLHGLTTGKYKNDNLRGEASLTAAKNTRAGLQATKTTLSAEYAQKQQQLQQLQYEVDQLTTKSYQLHATFERLRGRNIAEQQKIHQLKTRAAQANYQLHQVRQQSNVANSAENVESLKRQKQALQAEVDNLSSVLASLQQL